MINFKHRQTKIKVSFADLKTLKSHIRKASAFVRGISCLAREESNETSN